MSENVLRKQAKDKLETFLTEEMDLSSPVEIASQLEFAGFTEDQAQTVASEIYQPLRKVIASLLPPIRERG